MLKMYYLLILINEIVLYFKEMSDSSDVHNNTTIVTRSRQQSPFKMSSISDDDSDFDFKIKNKTKATKRYCFN